MNKRIIVAHPGKQHSFRLATALKEEGILLKYITTVYDKKDSLLMKLVKIFLGKDNLKRARSRNCEALDDRDVVQFCELMGLIELLLLRIDKTQKSYIWWNKITSDAFGIKVAKYAIKNHADAVIMYDSTAVKAFELLKIQAPSIRRIMDSSSANRIFMKDVFKDIINNTGNDSLKRESKYFWSQNQQNRFLKEILYTDFFLVPSCFAKQSLMYSGILEENIFIVPYGTNLNVEIVKSNNTKKNIKFLFVGQCTYRKGVNYLLKAFSEIVQDDIELALIGSVNKDVDFYKEYCSSEKIKFYGYVTQDKMKEFYEISDVFIFPSLSEGLTLAGLEAMGCGLPVICTTNSGIDDLIIEGKNGFVIPICNIVKIKEKILWFIKNKERILEMGENARQTALNYTWENYKLNILRVLDHMFKSQGVHNGKDL